MLTGVHLWQDKTKFQKIKFVISFEVIRDVFLFGLPPLI